ncbi:nucleotidyl transferase AbiEii/AbiGii toxin family protein [Actinotignum sp. GS-2025b]|uniref:nucleotidyl transferase AbiEii/AbiGii toxin family protein n=1 Tax=Actinotignum sp. GS-2025b TaxID=3427275 RepID=UPI003F446CCB
MENLEFQRKLTRLILSKINEYGFVLCGSGALREHGIITRPTEDIDLFTVQKHADTFPLAYQKVVETCIEYSFKVATTHASGQYANLVISDGDNVLSIDMGVDWRGFPPTTLHIGPVLAEEDAAGSKVAALFSRAEPRDYLDVDSLRRSGRHTDDQLITLAKESDLGFDMGFFIQRLEACAYVDFDEVAQYGISEEEFHAIQERYAQWHTSLNR